MKENLELYHIFKSFKVKDNMVETKKCFYCEKESINLTNFKSKWGRQSNKHYKVMICGDCREKIREAQGLLIKVENKGNDNLKKLLEFDKPYLLYNFTHNIDYIKEGLDIKD